MSEEIQLSWFGKIGFMCLTILLLLLLGATMGVIIASKTRMIDLEDRVVKLEAIDRVTHIREQAEAFEQLKERFDRLEASISLSKENVAKGLDSLGAKMAKKMPQKSESSRSSKVSKRISKKHYHTVSAGETLYSISRRYGLTIKKIQLLNKLSDRFVIYPGQKLLVTL
jgi:nucleoid-associated protein YgaU